MKMDPMMCMSYQKLPGAECYAWLTAACAIGESRRWVLENGFALMKDMEHLSAVPKIAIPNLGYD